MKEDTASARSSRDTQLPCREGAQKPLKRLCVVVPVTAPAEDSPDSQRQLPDCEGENLPMRSPPAFEPLSLIPHGAEMHCPHQYLPDLQIHEQNQCHGFKPENLGVVRHSAIDDWNTVPTM